MSTASQNTAPQQITKDSGVNFSLYYNTLNFFKNIMKNHPSIAKVTQGDVYNFDTTQFPQYPVGNVLISAANFTNNTTDYRIQLIVADKSKTLNDSDIPNRKDNKQEVPFYGTNDMVDIHSNTMSILNDLTSYVQKGNYGMEVNGTVNCVPFADRFNNGLVGWSAEFDLTVHNDRNRCLFFLSPPSGSYFKIEDCETGDEFNAVLGASGSIGQVFATKYVPNPTGFLQSYDNIRCFEIKDEINDRDDYNFFNLPVLQIPYEDFGTCEACELWTSPKVWGTTPERYDNNQIDDALREWQFT